MVNGILSIIVTVVSGVLVFIVGQILTQVWLDPLRQYKDLKKKIAYTLVYYANIYSTTAALGKAEYEEVSNNTRKIAAELSGFAQTLFWIHIGIPKKETLLKASESLIGLSNSFGHNTESDSNLTAIINAYKDDIENKLSLNK